MREITVYHLTLSESAVSHSIQSCEHVNIQLVTNTL